MQFSRIGAALIVAMVCTFSFVQEALAWGSCGRGPWVYSGTSSCSCGNGQAGYAYEGGAGANVTATAGPSNGWVAIEYEAYDEDDIRVFVPGATIAWGNYQPIWISNYNSYTNYQYHWPWASGYSYTGRFRSVCLTNYTNFSYPNSPWGY